MWMWKHVLKVKIQGIAVYWHKYPAFILLKRLYEHTRFLKYFSVSNTSPRNFETQKRYVPTHVVARNVLFFPKLCGDEMKCLWPENATRIFCKGKYMWRSWEARRISGARLPKQKRFIWNNAERTSPQHNCFITWRPRDRKNESRS